MTRKELLPKLNWTDIEDIALALRDKYPDQDPSFIRFTDLHKWVLELPDWVGREITDDLRYRKFNMEKAAKRGEHFWLEHDSVSFRR